MMLFIQFWSDQANWISLGKQLWTPVGMIAFGLGMIFSGVIVMVVGK